ncbi:AmmeMemoRadiSam system protein B [Desulfovibrio litoralis]|uniref:MEMO1 family protein n=1 Tax=Desulfovibrio litoralis DSM 11393 TaxID=1121455 RepID=A0A1M7SCD8_9BACT|nr:AmmeMemoRadiSam system protein B [Desulfovibrio litoralis]SHN56161.1 hypothetical protein SAMN02745728_00757 [Desulfovibrio litoralis DSM 11393]
MQNLSRKPIVSGRFYPDNAQELGGVVKRFLEVKSGVVIPEKPSLMTIIPHAGYLFSGVVAGATLGTAHLEKNCILLGPNHTGRGEALSVWPGGEWLSPLGAVPVNSSLAKAIIDAKLGFVADTEAHLGEHSLEVTLPFIQEKLCIQDKGICIPPHIVPICVASVDFETLKKAGQGLGKLIKKYNAQHSSPVSLIVSSDMSHYVSAKEASRLDSLALNEVLSLDPKGLFDVVNREKISMCGVAPAVLGLFAALELGASKAYKVAYTNSGETGSSFGATMDSVVGYAGIIVQ